jgi:hypothetical protein
VIFVVVEDGTVEVLDGLEAAQEYEPFDVENEVFLFYDEDGTWLRPRFTRPNRRRLFGLVLEQGAFVLERSPALDAAVDPFHVAVGEALALEPNAHFKSLVAVREYAAALQGGSR